MRTTLLVSCAATALLIGVAGASAQAPEHKSTPGLSKQGPAAAGPAKSATPAEHGMAEHRSAAEAPKGKDSPKADAMSPSNEPKSHQGAANDKGAKSESSATQTGRSAATGKSEPSKTDMRKTDASKTEPGKTDPSTTGANTTNPTNTQTGRSARSTSATTGAGDRVNTTTQTGVSAQERSGSATSVQIDAQKQERIRTTLASTKVENISHADFSVSVGTRVPERYHFHPLPTEIVDIVPEYRGFDYMVVDNEIVIVNPSTREIVYTMKEGRSAGMNRPSVDCR
jgi:uncharacterized protein DUF1236